MNKIKLTSKLFQTQVRLVKLSTAWSPMQGWTTKNSEFGTCSVWKGISVRRCFRRLRRKDDANWFTVKVFESPFRMNVFLEQRCSLVGNTAQIWFCVQCLLNIETMHFLNGLGVLFKTKYVSIFLFWLLRYENYDGRTAHLSKKNVSDN